MEPRATVLDILARDRAGMRFNNRTHDRQTHPQSFRFGSEEVVEESLACFLGNPNSVITHTRPNCAVAIPLCDNYDFTAAHRRIAHGIKGIDKEIEQDLLQLDRIAFNRRQIWLEQRLQLARAQHRITFYHVHHVHYKIVQIYPLPDLGAFFHHAANTANHFAGAASICDDINEQFAYLTEIDIPAINKTLSRAGVADNSRKRLIYFMGNGGRQFTHHGHATEMTNFFMALSCFRFSELASRDVRDRSQNKHALRRLNGI